ncbi:MAG TPA: biopolymer transporter ExbD [Steroidobacteraceae bacterium]|nr:biopolymer transporter ExbD [Steroidobacteraceae bacterium]
MRRSYQARKLARHNRRPAELLLVPMIDIFTVLVTFLLMTAVFSRTVILELNLPSGQADLQNLPKDLQLEVVVRRNLMEVDDRSTGPIRSLPNTPQGYDYDALTDLLKQIKARYPQTTAATVLLEPGIAYDTLVQVMDHVRVFEASNGFDTAEAELFPDISIGDAPPAAGASP